MKKPSRKKSSHPHGVSQRKAIAMDLAPAAPTSASAPAPAVMAPPSQPMAMKKGGKVCSKS